MESSRPVRCAENQAVASYLLMKRQELADNNAVSENVDLTLSIAHRNIANSKTPIATIKDLSQIKGVGKWILRLMQGFFPSDADSSQTGKETQKGKKTKGPKRYVPQKNSVAYALLITLYREISNGNSFMRKQELIDAAEASGLSRTSIAPERGVGKPGQFGSSPRDWYTGWSCMKTLISKGLVAKSSFPAKYMLTDEGKETARECLVRSGGVDSAELLSRTDGSLGSAHAQDASESGFILAPTIQKRVQPSAGSGQQIMSVDCSTEPFRKNVQMDHFSTPDSDSAEVLEEDCVMLPVFTSTGLGNDKMSFRSGNVLLHKDSSFSGDSAPRSSILQPCTSFDNPVHVPSSNGDELEGCVNALAMPPCRYGEKFEDIYDIILILDDRENFGARSRKVVDIINSQFKIQVEIRRLPVGDGLWLARHKHMNNEYVLDFIVERKRVDDLQHSIRDNRYRDQKLRLLRCGLQKLIYLVEGDPNACETAESIKTACFTTNILEGFDVQRTSGLTETVRRYGHLTQAINQFYRRQFLNDKNDNDRVCPSYDEFVKRCQNLEKMTISDVFALQLVQVPQVTEEIALAVLDLYPTLLSLARAYALLEGDVRAQEEMLKNKSSLISGGASKNIYKLVWG